MSSQKTKYITWILSLKALDQSWQFFTEEYQIQNGRARKMLVNEGI